MFLHFGGHCHVAIGKAPSMNCCHRVGSTLLSKISLYAVTLRLRLRSPVQTMKNSAKPKTTQKYSDRGVHIVLAIFCRVFPWNLDEVNLLKYEQKCQAQTTKTAQAKVHRSIWMVVSAHFWPFSYVVYLEFSKYIEIYYKCSFFSVVTFFFCFYHFFPRFVAHCSGVQFTDDSSPRTYWYKPRKELPDFPSSSLSLIWYQQQFLFLN